MSKMYTTEEFVKAVGELYGNRAKVNAKQYALDNGVEMGDLNDRFDALFIYAWTTESIGFWSMVEDRVMRHLKENEDEQK